MMHKCFCGQKANKLFFGKPYCKICLEKKIKQNKLFNLIFSIPLIKNYKMIFLNEILK